MRAFVPIEDAQVSFQILGPSTVSRLPHLLRTVPPSITHQAAADYDTLVEWALASIIAGDGAAEDGQPTPDEVAHDPTVCQNQTYLGREALRQTHVPIREGGLELARWMLARFRCVRIFFKLHQRHNLHQLPRLHPGTCRRCFHPG